MVELPTHNSALHFRSGHNCVIGLTFGSFMFFCLFLAQPTPNYMLTKAPLESHGMRIWLQISKFAAPNGGIPGPTKFFHFTCRGLPCFFPESRAQLRLHVPVEGPGYPNVDRRVTRNLSTWPWRYKVTPNSTTKWDSIVYRMNLNCKEYRGKRAYGKRRKK
jgi:hypothetical protein